MAAERPIQRVTTAPGAAPRLAVIGGGWAGLAAAVRAVEKGWQVSLFEMAAQLGGRARSLGDGKDAPDNGQHILIGAYARTLHLMHTVGVIEKQVLLRQRLRLQYADGRCFALPPGPQALAFARATWACTAWTPGQRLSLLRWAAGMALRGFNCPADWTVDRLAQNLPAPVRQMLIDPLCVAALNTPAPAASAQVLLRVLKDALLGGPGSADLLLPKQGLQQLLPAAARQWLAASGRCDLRLGTRVQSLQDSAEGCTVNGEAFDAAVLACSAIEAARLAQPLNATWAAEAAAIRYEPIVTVLLSCSGARLPAPMMALQESTDAPAQFVLDHGALGWVPHRFAFVISGAAAWLERGLQATADATLRQAMAAFPAGTWPTSLTLLRALAEKRATFRCTPGLARPGLKVSDRVFAAGDYVAGPYPATLEGAVRAGENAVVQLQRRPVSSS